MITDPTTGFRAPWSRSQSRKLYETSLLVPSLMSRFLRIQSLSLVATHRPVYLLRQAHRPRVRPLEDHLHCFPCFWVVYDKIQLQVLRQKGQNSRSRVLSSWEIKLRGNTVEECCFCAADYASSVLMAQSEGVLRILDPSPDYIQSMRRALPRCVRYSHVCTGKYTRYFKELLLCTRSVRRNGGIRLAYMYGMTPRHDRAMPHWTPGYRTTSIKSRDGESSQRSRLRKPSHPRMGVFFHRFRGLGKQVGQFELQAQEGLQSVGRLFRQPHHRLEPAAHRAPYMG